jgi:PKD repeat protein
MKKAFIYIAFFSLSIVSCSTDDEPVIPIACMQVDFHNAPRNMPIHFTSCSTDADELLWNMGDGGNSFTFSTVYYAYSDTGTYVVTLIATTGNFSDTITDTIHITD